MADLIKLETIEGEQRVDSRLIAKELGVENRFLIRTIKNYQSDFEEFGVVRFQNALPKKKSKGGMPQIFAFLNKEHANLYLTYSKNTFEARQLKKKLVRTFAYYEKALMRQLRKEGQLAWQQARSKGKLIRREETDTIKLFAEYATAQGSKNAKMYYVNISKMVNKSLFFFEQALPKPNIFRDLLDRFQIANLTTADILVAKTLKEEMLKGTHYKDIYTVVKGKVEALADVIGKTQAIGSQDVKHIEGVEKNDKTERE